MADSSKPTATATAAAAATDGPMPPPPNWLACPRVGQPIDMAPFILCKSPIASLPSAAAAPRWAVPIEYAFTLSMLVKFQSSKQLPIGLIVDLTDGALYRGHEEAASLCVAYSNLPVDDKPTQENIESFNRLCSNYHNNNPTHWIVVHDIYGYNSAAFLVACFMVDVHGRDIADAFHAVAASRPPGIFDSALAQALFDRYEEAMPFDPAILEPPAWAAEPMKSNTRALGADKHDKANTAAGAGAGASEGKIKRKRKAETPLPAPASAIAPAVAHSAPPAATNPTLANKPAAAPAPAAAPVPAANNPPPSAHPAPTPAPAPTSSVDISSVLRAHNYLVPVKSPHLDRLLQTLIELAQCDPTTPVAFPSLSAGVSRVFHLCSRVPLSAPSFSSLSSQPAAYSVTWLPQATQCLMLVLKEGCFLSFNNGALYHIPGLYFPRRKDASQRVSGTLLFGELLFDRSDSEPTPIPRYLINDVISFEGRPVVYSSPLSARAQIGDADLSNPRAQLSAPEKARSRLRVRAKIYFPVNKFASALTMPLPHPCDGLIFCDSRPIATERWLADAGNGGSSDERNFTWVRATAASGPVTESNIIQKLR